jgi:hypothetical protein
LVVNAERRVAADDATGRRRPADDALLDASPLPCVVGERFTTAPHRRLRVIASRTDRLLVAALAGVAVGALPPWFLRNPFYDGVSLAVYYPGQGSGLETWGLATLPLAVLAVGVLVARGGRVATTSAAVVGAAATVVALEATVEGVRVPWLLPGPGVAITAASGLAVLALVARQRSNAGR